MCTRRRFKQSVPLAERLAAWVEDVRKEMEKLPLDSPERERLLKKMEQANSALRFETRGDAPIP